MQFEFNVTLDMLISLGQYTDSVPQSMIGVHAYYQQVSDLIFKALKFCTPQDSVGDFCNLVQQAEEPFPEFLTHASNAVEKRVPFG